MLVAGAAVQWLRDGLGLIETAAETEQLAPAGRVDGRRLLRPRAHRARLAALGPDARGLICGLTRGTTRAHLARAALEAIAHQVADVLDVLPLSVDVLRVDGGATANRFLMQFQADLIGARWRSRPTPRRPRSARRPWPGSGSACGERPPTSRDSFARATVFEPTMDGAQVADHRDGWRRALARAL